ncbi:SCO family protein [Stenotrophomonas sp. 24(2023)]|uniref:SCO family protein n=1 Tax=Stenotrophomonas sp. 24(2023) TaxID=3068324 RepID=UPI0027DEFF62|nr:SCO family protein [Stenotrophomonas sp. 24(2023)]WMJ70854.1 SCO family protein [Stenotrophomonas sp. 24(2023)]
MNTRTPIPHRLRLPALVLAFGVALLAGCSGKTRMDFNARDVACQGLGNDWSMPDTQGVMRTQADLRGKVTYLFFGFTSCPDVCPTTMVDMARVKHLMGSQADQLQVVFVTVDPQRDTPQAVDAYVHGFDPHAIGLVGDARQLDAMAGRFKAFYEREPGPVPGSYTMSHTAGGYVFDTQGRLRLFAPYGMATEALFSDVQRLLLEPAHMAGAHPVPACRA